MSANDIINKYNHYYDGVVQNPTPETINKVVKNDDNCLRQFGKGSHNSSYACEYCELLGNLVNLKKGPPKEILIQAGDLKGTTIRIETHEAPIISAKWDDRVKARHESYKKAFNDNDNEIAEKYITVDPWANDLVIEWILRQVYEDTGIQHVIPSIGSFVCGNNGYKLRINIDDVITTLPMNEKNALQLLLQLGTALRIVRHYNFVQVNASVKTLQYTLEPISYTYHDIEIDSPFTLFLSDFSWSSIEWKDVRIVPYAKGHHIDVLRAIENHEPISTKMVNVKRETIWSEEGPTYCGLFRINPDTIGLFMALRYSGYPLYGGVIDFYSYLVSLLSWGDFRRVVDDSDRLKSFINSLFPKKDFVQTWPRPEETGLLTCPIEIAKYLSGYYLYCDVFERFLNA